MAMTKLGALWKNKNGKDMFSGVIEIDDKKTRIVVFANGFKDDDKKPDYIIYLSEDQAQKTNNSTAEKTNNQTDNPFNDSDVPF